MNKRKAAAVRQMNTDALKNILGSLSDQEASSDKTKYPLAGLVHLKGIGQVPVATLRAELARREAS